MLVVGLMRAVTFHGHHVENDTVVNHAVDSSHGGHRIFENAFPFAENQIGGDQHRFAFIAFSTLLFIMRPSLAKISN